MKRGVSSIYDAKRQRTETQSDIDSNDDAMQIDENEWEEAEDYFSHPISKKSRSLPTKFAKNGPILHSFIRLDSGDIIAMANKNIEGTLGEGNFGIVVKGLKRDRTECAVKIEAGKKRNANDTQVRIMKKINYHLGETDRILPKRKIFKGKWTKSKRYTVYAFLRGKELAKQIPFLNANQKLIVALKCAQALQILHQKRIIHADIKPENFIAEIHGNHITAKTCDYDFSMMLPNNKDFIESNIWCGTNDYMAPEIGSHLETSTYSFASDIYALGMMFKNDLKLPRDIYQPMIYVDRNRRCSLDSTIEKLSQKIDLNHIIANYDNLTLDTDSDTAAEPIIKKHKIGKTRRR